LKTAVLIASEMRSFSYCLPTIRWHLLRHFDDLTFFISTVEDEYTESAKLLEKYYPKDRIHIEIPDRPVHPIIESRDPYWAPKTDSSPLTIRDIFSHEPFAISVTPERILQQAWQLQQCWRLMEEESKIKFDTYIRLRPDSYFRDFRFDSVYSQPSSHHVYVPWWAQCGGINDRFAILGSFAAKVYFNYINEISSLIQHGCPFHPESLLEGALTLAGCKIGASIIIDFAKLYMPSGFFRDPEVSWQDLAERLTSHT